MSMSTSSEHGFSSRAGSWQVDPPFDAKHMCNQSVDFVVFAVWYPVEYVSSMTDKDVCYVLPTLLMTAIIKLSSS